MVMHFKYKQVARPDGTLVKIPSIPITLIGETSIDVIALVDSGADISVISGADISVIPKEMGELLGLDLSGRKDFAYGIGGKVKTVEVKVGVVVEKGHERYSFRMPLKVVLDKYDFPPLLGRKGFFNEFVITINEEKERISLKKYHIRTY